ncbi:MAG: bifunctional oligoribonuclease/PAP phosphatase NrnA [Clostridiales bacterium]|jgi:phosphoesterase RecJ-like protein|nr:bifunctional oligoribonuclease/PAP phosphatase NrnA [Clostridiales bacterium]
MKNDLYHLIHQKIIESERVVITSHLRPDGDSICTGLALAKMGEALGKKMSLINRDPTPFPFSQMPEAAGIKIGQVPARRFDLVILLECASVARSGQKNLGGYFKINIDHHYSNDSYADINWVDPEASAVGEMVFLLSEKTGLPLTPEIASHLYCAIVSDTGSFQFSNTTSRAFDVCHKLVRLGANPIKTTEFLFNTNPPEKIKLLGHVLSTLRMNKKGTIATITMFKKFLRAFHLREIDTEDITTLARSIKGVEMVLFFKEMARDTFRISLRSKGLANAAAIAEQFGGGGHVHAAGFTASGPYDKLIRDIPRQIEKFLEQKRESALKIHALSSRTE